MVYICKIPSTGYTVYESISFDIQSDLVIYSVDRIYSQSSTLVMLEIGSYSISNGVITINTEKFHAVGIFTEEKIVIDDKEYIREN